MAKVVLKMYKKVDRLCLISSYIAHRCIFKFLLYSNIIHNNEMSAKESPWTSMHFVPTYSGLPNKQ